MFNFRYFIQDNLPTGNSVALVNNSQRSLVAYLGAAEHLPLDDLQNNENVLNILRNTDYVYIEGFFNKTQRNSKISTRLLQ